MPRLALAFFVSYIILRLTFDHLISVSASIAYATEGLLCVAFLALFRGRLSFTLKIHKSYIRFLGLNFLLGGLVCLIAQVADWKILIDTSQGDVVFLLLFVAPILEEFIFRMLLWEPLKIWKVSDRTTLGVTSLLFSLSHFTAYFVVPEEYAPFVLFQAFYTLLVALHWGQIRIQQGTVFATILLHFCFNLGFYVANRNPTSFSFKDSTPKVLVIDLSIDPERAKEIFGENAPEVLNAQTSQPDATTCEDNMKIVNMHFEGFAKGAVPEWTEEQVQQLKAGVRSAHPYHTWGTLLRDLPKIHGYHYNAKAPADTAMYANPQLLFASVQEELQGLRDAMEQVHPDIVVAPTSESFGENYIEFLTAGNSPEQAQEYAQEIVDFWSEAWTSLGKRFPESLFIVSAGNGGEDGQADLISPDDTKNFSVPAGLDLDNFWVVAASDAEGCLTPYANYSSEYVDVASPGDLIESTTGCKGMPRVRLSGSSQAVATFSAWAIEELNAGNEIKDSVKKKARAMNCNSGKLKYGSL